MEDKKIITRILKLDKDIYNELLVIPNSLQRSLAIFVTTSVLVTLSIHKFFGNVIKFFEDNIPILSEVTPKEELDIIRLLIEDLKLFYSETSSISVLTTNVLTSITSSAIGTFIVFFILKYLFRKEPSFRNIVIIFCFSSIPGLLSLPILFLSSLFLQGIILVFISIYSFITFGSGMKQVYMLRNIEVILLIVAITFGSSLLSSFQL